MKQGPTTTQTERQEPHAVRHLQREAIRYSNQLLSESQDALTDLQVLRLLQKWDFRPNFRRTNVTPQGMDFVKSNTLGFATPKDPDRPPALTSDTRCCEPVLAVFAKWIQYKFAAKYEMPEFHFTSVSVNADFASKVHRDANNEGPSLAIALGDFDGGYLQTWPNDNKREKLAKLALTPSVRHYTKYSPYVFDGRLANSVSAFSGKRFSLVFYTCSWYQQIPQDVAEQMRHAAGVRIPSAEELDALCLQVGRSFSPCIDPVLAFRVQQNRERAKERKHWRQARQLAQPHVPREAGALQLLE